jgi:hypothetical protein
VAAGAQEGAVVTRSAHPRTAALSPTVLSLVAAAVLGGCALAPDRSLEAGPAAPAFAVDAPGPFDGRTYDADLLVVSAQPLPSRDLRRVERRREVRRAAPLSLFTVATGGSTVTVAAADPADLRAFSGERVAEQADVWDRVAAGQAVLSSTAVPDGPALTAVALDASGALPAVGVAAVADLPVQADVLVNPTWATALSAPVDNAVLVDARGAGARAELQRVLGDRAQVIDLDGADAVPQPAYLTGGAVAEAVGSFTYYPQEDGTIDIEPSWVQANIVTGEVPILGNVTCHRVVLPQLRAAMQELVDSGLQQLVRPDQYGGCWVPRFIASDPARGLSLHSWGIALDLNVATNQRGTSGDMDPRVVDVMARWGFAWGGTWSDPDPMHFELAALVAP